MPLEIRVLGPLEVLVDGVPLHVDTRKAIAILVLLAVDGRAYAREELATLFWPESDDESARSALRRTLSVLRSALGDRWLTVDRGAVALAPGPEVRLDLAELDAAAADGTLSRLRDAASLARGPFLAGFGLREVPDFDDWRATRAVGVERRIGELLERLAEAAAHAGDLDGAVAAAARSVELDPLDEPARHRLMTLLARNGDRTGAIREYRALVAVLERELGVEPLAETTRLYEAIRDAAVGVPDTPEPTPEAQTMPAPVRLPLVGRDAESVALAALLADVSRTGNGRIAAVTGEAGIGKSRLVEELAASVRSGRGLALAARAYPSEGAIAYAPLVELLRAGMTQPGGAGRIAQLHGRDRAELARLVALPPGVGAPRILDGGASPAARVRLLDALATALAALVAADAPGVVVVEDVQWADAASREALLYLGRRLEGRRLLLLLTWRPEDLGADGESFAADVRRVPGSTEVALGRLGADAVQELLAAGGNAARRWPADRLIAESEGLPLYVVEAVAAGPSDDDTAPRTVRALLRDRLAPVSERARQVLAAAAVVGRTVDLETLCYVSGRTEEEVADAIDELLRRGIVRETAANLAPVVDFAHARLRDEVLESVSLARSRLLHRRAADALRAVPGRVDAGRLAQLARHEQAAGRDVEAARAYRAAGMLARSVYANHEALGHLTAALALGDPDATGLQVAIGEVRTALGDYGGAIAALEVAAAASEGPTLAKVELRLGQAHSRRGDVRTAASHLDAALDALREPIDRLPAVLERGTVALRSGELELAARLAVEAKDVAADLGIPHGLAAAARLAGLVALEQGDLAAARSALLRSVDFADRVPDDPRPGIAARNGLAVAEARLGNREGAVALLDAALAACPGAGEPHLEAAVENNLADQLHALGRPEAAMAHLRRAVALFADVGGLPGEFEPEIWKLVVW